MVAYCKKLVDTLTCSFHLLYAAYLGHTVLVICHIHVWTVGDHLGYRTLGALCDDIRGGLTHQGDQSEYSEIQGCWTWTR